ncbi:MAG: branched-chain amino acid ABC transporter substrate-binding protein [Planctomycetota bacterium]
MKKQMKVWCLALGLAVVLLGCGSKSDTVKIGVAGPLTGEQSKMGTDVLHGVQLAVDEWNAKGGLWGKTIGGMPNKKIEIVQRDDEAKEQQAKTVAEELINAGVVGIIGHFNSGCTIPASETYYRNGVPIITPSSTNPKVTERKDAKTGESYWNVFRVCGRDDVQGERAARYVIEKLKAQRVVVIHDKTAYGQGLANYFKATIEKLGKPENIVYYGGFDAKERNFRPYLSAVQEKNPDVVYFGGIYNQAGLLVLQMRDLGINVPFLSGDGVIDPEFLKTAGKSAEGSCLTFAELLPFAAGIYEKFPAAKKFNEEYQSKFGQAGPYSVYAYDAANILISSIQKANSTDGKKIADVIHKDEHDCCIGKIRFDQKGDIIGSFYVIWEVKNGDFSFVEK